MKFNLNKFFDLKYRVYSTIGSSGGRLIYHLDIKYWFWPFWISSRSLYRKMVKLEYINNTSFATFSRETAKGELNAFCKGYMKYRSYKKKPLKTGTIEKGSVCDIGFLESI